MDTKKTTVVDVHGNPFLIADLKQQQTDDAKLGHLHKHYADHPSRGLTPGKLASILMRAEQGDLIAQCELAEDMEEKDGHLFAELQKRRLCLQEVDWKIVPPRNATPAEIKDTEMLQEQFEDMVFLDGLIFDMSDAILKSFSNSEITWQQDQKLWVPEKIEFKDPGWFKPNPDNRNELMLRDNSVSGAHLQTFGWIKHVHKTKSGYLDRNGLARVLAWPYLFKNYSIRDLAEFLEIYGLPLRLGKYPTGASDNEKQTLLRAVMSIGHNAGGIIPKGMEIEFQDAAKGTQGPFDSMIDRMEKIQSKAILGGTLTSQADGKSSTNALGNVHNEVRQELRNSDRKQIDATLTRDLVLPMYLLNCKSFSHPGRCPRFESDLTEGEDIGEYSTALSGLVGVGFKIPVEWAHNKLQIPMPKEGEDILGVVAAAPVNSDKPVKDETPLDKPLKGSQQEKEKAALKQAAIIKIAALKAKSENKEQPESQPENQPDEIDNLNKQVALKMTPVLQGFTDEIEALVTSASSLEELQSKLSKMDLSIDEASEVIQQALVISELAGQLDVIEGN